MNRPKLTYRPNGKGPLPEDFTGKKIGKRFVIGPAPREGCNRPRWRVRCDCGNEYSCLSQDVRRGKGCIMCGHKGDRPWRRKRPYESSLNALKGRTEHPVLITYEEFVSLASQKECHYCGADVHWQKHRTRKKEGSGSNLDRKDSKGPYSMDNVVVCCGRCNYGKNRWFTYDEWVQIGAVIRTWGKPKCEASA